MVECYHEKERGSIMKKTVVCILTGAALAVSMIGSTACFAEEQKTFTVGFDAEYPPYGYMDENGE